MVDNLWRLILHDQPTGYTQVMGANAGVREQCN